MSNKKSAAVAEPIEETSSTEIASLIKPIVIRGASIKDSFCNYIYELTSGPTYGDGIRRSGASVIHNDLQLAMDRLKPHLAVICEQIDDSKIKDIEDLESLDPTGDYKTNSIEKRILMFFVTGFTLEGSGENESVTLSGFRRLSTGEDLPLKSPKTKWAGVYQFIDELRATVDLIIHEVEEYMDGKCAPKMVQQEMGFDTEVIEGEGK
jgi:hypothetical protein